MKNEKSGMTNAHIIPLIWFEFEIFGLKDKSIFYIHVGFKVRFAILFAYLNQL